MSSMAGKSTRIEHQGIVDHVDRGSVWVNILQQAACLSCSVKGACSASDSENKLVEIKQFMGSYERGQQVTVFYERSLGFKALMWGYILPFVLLMVVLIVASQLISSETMAGLLALGSLVPYYAGLYIMRDRIGQEFSFRIESSKPEPVQFSGLQINR